MLGQATSILFWGEDFFTTKKFKQFKSTHLSDYTILLRDVEFKIENSLLSPCNIVVVQLCEGFNPISSITATWPEVPIVVLGHTGLESELGRAIETSQADPIVIDKDEAYLKLLGPALSRLIRMQRSRFKIFEEKDLRNRSGQSSSSGDPSDVDFKQLYSLLRAMTDTVPEMIWAKDLDGKYIYTNTATCKFLLNTTNTHEPIGRGIMEFVERERKLHPEVAEWYTYGENCEATDQVTLRQGRLSHFKEAATILGTPVILDIYKAPLLNDAGERLGTVGTARDITIHEETKERYRKLFDFSPDPVVVHIDGIIIAANQAAADFVGAETAEDHLGENIFNFVPVDEREAYVKKIQQNVALPRENRAIESRYLTLDGTIRDVETVSVPIKYGNQNAWMVTFRDITERKLAREQVQRSLREKEALLNEIYHRTKNNMQVVSSIINIRSRDVKDEVSLQMFKEIRDRIAAMSLAHDRLYDAQDLSAIDFKPYLELLSANLRQSYTSTADRAPIQIEADPVIISIDQAVPLGLVINEILSNAYKYAFPGERTGLVELCLKYAEDKELEIIVRDDGIGLPVDLFNDSLSTIIITGLVEDQLGGTVSYDGNDGTRFLIRIPDSGVVRRI